MISFKGCHFPKPVILHAIYFYLRYSVSLRDLEEILAERGIVVDHATLSRWVVKFSPLVAIEAHKRKRPSAVSWRMDETYIKVRGQWLYLYRAVDRDGKTLDFMLSGRRNTDAATQFFAKTLTSSGIPLRVVIDKSGANGAGIKEVNKTLRRLGCRPRSQLFGPNTSTIVLSRTIVSSNDERVPCSDSNPSPQQQLRLRASKWLT